MSILVTYNVPQFVNSHKHHRIDIHELLARVPLSQTEYDILTLVLCLGCLRAIRCGLIENRAFVKIRL